MNKNWRKAIYESTPLKTIFKKYRSRDAGTTTNKKKEKRNLCTNLIKKSMKGHFRNVSEGKLFFSKVNFGKIIKPFLTNKGFIVNNDTSIEGENKIITTDKDLSETFNNQYVNIIEKQQDQRLKRTFICFLIWRSILIFQKSKTPM